LPSRPSALALPATIQDFPGDDEFSGPNPPEAATLYYYLKKRHLLGDFKIEVFDPQGTLISTLQSAKRRGLNRADWPMRLRAPQLPPANTLVGSAFAMLGPRVPPGTYTVKLTKGQEVHTSQLQLVADPRSRYSDEDRAAQYKTAMDLYNQLERLSYVVDAAVAARDQASQRAEALGKNDRNRKALEALAADLEKFRTGLVSSEGLMGGGEQLREKLGELYGAVNGYEGRPTRSQTDRVEVLRAELDEAVARFETLRSRNLAEVNRGLEKAKVQPVRLMTQEEWQEKREKG
ncbi:MAG TPA: glycosyl hydrolase, partial [Thermoanaerobaculia bacterium]|nr:glycosyl hydrolase [Thermoanaerobaculia bacterium]